ncbi:hypothetical protein AAGP88_22815, partial [Klebsiella pneumoniae]
SAQIREILISESAWEEMTCLFAPSLSARIIVALYVRSRGGIKNRDPGVDLNVTIKLAFCVKTGHL